MVTKLQNSLHMPKQQPLEEQMYLLLTACADRYVAILCSKGFCWAANAAIQTEGINNIPTVKDNALLKAILHWLPNANTGKTRVG